MIELLLLRHAATSWNADKRLQGRRDIALSQAGRDSLLGRSIPTTLLPRRWYCSPLQRCRQTATLLGIEPIEACSAWIEMDWGQWEGQRISQLRLDNPELLARQEARGLDMTPTDGESPRQVRQRLMQWLSEQDNGTEQKFGIVCHKGVIRALLSQALDWDMTDKCPVKIDWQQALLFEWTPTENLKLKRYNLPLQVG